MGWLVNRRPVANGWNPSAPPPNLASVGQPFPNRREFGLFPQSDGACQIPGFSCIYLFIYLFVDLCINVYILDMMPQKCWATHIRCSVAFSKTCQDGQPPPSPPPSSEPVRFSKSGATRRLSPGEHSNDQTRWAVGTPMHGLDSLVLLSIS